MKYFYTLKIIYRKMNLTSQKPVYYGAGVLVMQLFLRKATFVAEF
jgi:hypothetical protein